MLTSRNNEAQKPSSFPTNAPSGKMPANLASNWLIIGVLLLVGCVYIAMASWHSYDVDHWFVPWLQQMTTQGAWHALGAPLQVETDGALGSANYNPPYLYLLAIGDLLGSLLSGFAIVKLVSVGGTLFCAICLFVLIRTFMPTPDAVLATSTFLLLPTVVLNGPGWGQTDAIYSGWLALTVAAAFRERWVLMMMAFGAAIAFKLPAVFLGPFLVYVGLSRRVPYQTMLAVPVAYVVSLLPAWMAGRSVLDLVSIYLDQAGTYHWLSMKAPNPWAFIQYLRLVDYDTGVQLGIVCAALGGLVIAGLAFRSRMQGSDLLLVAVASVILIPYLLPKMHDRYFFPADVLSYAYAVVHRSQRSIGIALCVQMGSLLAYSSILFDIRSGPYMGAGAISLGLVLVGMQLADGLKRSASAFPVL